MKWNELSEGDLILYVDLAIVHMIIHVNPCSHSDSIGFVSVRVAAKNLKSFTHRERFSRRGNEIIPDFIRIAKVSK